MKLIVAGSNWPLHILLTNVAFCLESGLELLFHISTPAFVNNLFHFNRRRLQLGVSKARLIKHLVRERVFMSQPGAVSIPPYTLECFLRSNHECVGIGQGWGKTRIRNCGNGKRHKTRQKG